MAVIDADAHVIETERTWEYMSEAERPFQPLVLVPKGSGRESPEFWMVDGRIYPKNANIGKDTPDAARDLTDVAARLAHMDELGIDIQVLYPSLFLRPLTRRPEVELAISSSYNRWLADIWSMSENRLRWVAILPLMSMEKALEELHWAKENGACGAFMRGVEGDKRLSDPYFHALYQEASDLNLPICVHATSGNFPMYDVYLRDSGFAQFKLPVIGAFHDLLMQGTPERFPELRWAFIEVSSQWIPYAVTDLAIRFGKRGRNFPGRDLLKENRIYVACQTQDDLPYVLEYAGEDNIVIGTDYGHDDTASEIEALRRLREGGRVEGPAFDKILDDNPRRLYGL